MHAGYSRYFTPPPIELVAAPSVALFNNTTAAAPGSASTTPKAERADYYDIGFSQIVFSGFTFGLDGFDKQSRNMIDEGQFGAPIVLTPFNYQSGRQYGIELTTDYTNGAFSAYGNAAYTRAAGRNIVTSEFNFDPGDLAYIAGHYIPLDHQQIVTVSAGASYVWNTTRLSASTFWRARDCGKDGATPNGDHVPGYLQVNLGLAHDFDIGSLKGLTARFDVINLFDDKYQIRDGSGVGVGAPQFGPRRGFFIGLSKAL